MMPAKKTSTGNEMKKRKSERGQRKTKINPQRSPFICRISTALLFQEIHAPTVGEECKLHGQISIENGSKQSFCSL